MTHADVMHADGYWRQFPISVRFDDSKIGKPLQGTVVDLGEVKVRDEWLPKLRLQSKNGQVYVLVVGQAVLLAELVRLKPAKGDEVTITYHGEAKRAAPGLNPTKEFTVEVRRPGSQPGGKEGVRGSASSDPVPAGAGSQEPGAQTPLLVETPP